MVPKLPTQRKGCVPAHFFLQVNYAFASIDIFPCDFNPICVVFDCRNYQPRCKHDDIHGSTCIGQFLTLSAKCSLNYVAKKKNAVNSTVISQQMQITHLLRSLCLFVLVKVKQESRLMVLQFYLAKCILSQQKRQTQLRASIIPDYSGTFVNRAANPTIYMLISRNSGKYKMSLLNALNTSRLLSVTIPIRGEFLLNK